MNNITLPKVCEHLQPFLSQLLAQNGTSVVAVVTAWTAMKFVINLNKGPSLKELRASSLAKTASTFVEIGENVDQHYPLQVGIVCNQCKEGIAWPTPTN
jgi:hypothetical protein